MVFTIAVNLVFMPMHFLGLAGMPRRIPDYPDGYLGWNSFITLGSFLTFFSLVLFLWIVAAVIFNPNKDKVNNNLLSRWVH
jgi:heme/copper-type cytochrome/quinol oxidase subunit 1